MIVRWLIVVGGTLTAAWVFLTLFVVPWLAGL